VSARRRTTPRALGPLVPRVLRELGVEGAAAVLEVAESWEDVVGAEAAAHSRPVLLRGTVLEVEVDSSVWSQQLQMRRPEILARLRERLGSAAPRDLRLRIGTWT
jgi:predicted nucleic acid-binding Zn ribbon protein